METGRESTHNILDALGRLIITNLEERSLAEVRADTEDILALLVGIGPKIAYHLARSHETQVSEVLSTLLVAVDCISRNDTEQYGDRKKSSGDGEMHCCAWEGC